MGTGCSAGDLLDDTLSKPMHKVQLYCAPERLGLEFPKSVLNVLFCGVLGRSVLQDASVVFPEGSGIGSHCGTVRAYILRTAYVGPTWLSENCRTRKRYT